MPLKKKLMGSRFFLAEKAEDAVQISVIVPIHNVKEYLPACLKSLSCQTLDGGFEVVLVENGSTDGSALIAQKYARQHDFASYYHLQRADVSEARNFGAKQAKGAYLFFLDSDDRIAPDLLENLLRIAKRTKAELVMSDIARQEGKKYSNYVLHRSAFRNMPLVTTLEKSSCLVFDGIVCGRLIARSLYSRAGIRFRSGVVYEDAFPSFKLKAEAKSIAFYPGVGYFYRFREDGSSISQSPLSPHSFKCRIEAIQQCYDYACEKGLDWRIFRAFDLKVIQHDLMVVINRLDSVERERAMEIARQINELVKKWTLFDELEDCSLMCRQKYKYLRDLDLDSLFKVLAWQREYYSTVSLYPGKKGGYGARLPRDLFTEGRKNITIELRRYPPICKLVSIECDDAGLVLHGFAYHRRTTIPRGSQSIQAYLVNIETGMEMKLQAESERSEYAEEAYGEVIEKSTGKTYSYDLEGAGFRFAIPYEGLASCREMKGLNFIRVHYRNPLETGFAYTRRMSNELRKQLKETVFSSSGVSVRIEPGPLDTARVFVDFLDCQEG